MLLASDTASEVGTFAQRLRYTASVHGTLYIYSRSRKEFHTRLRWLRTSVLGRYQLSRRSLVRLSTSDSSLDYIMLLTRQRQRKPTGRPEGRRRRAALPASVAEEVYEAMRTLCAVATFRRSSPRRCSCRVPCARATWRPCQTHGHRSHKPAFG